jgi:hypothetical protein
VPAALVTFMEPPLLLSRGETLALGNVGIRSLEALTKTEVAVLASILGERSAKAVRLALAAPSTSLLGRG